MHGNFKKMLHILFVSLYLTFSIRENENITLLQTQRGAALYQGENLIGFACIHICRQKYGYLNLSKYLHIIQSGLSDEIPDLNTK